MKCFVILLLTLSSLNLFARDRELLKCLGSEEKRFHLKKEVGPIYDLNQRLIAEVTQIPSVEISPEDYLEICAGEKKSAAMNLLELSIRKGKGLFTIPSDLSGMQRQMTILMIEDYAQATKEIFLQFISQIQTVSPTPTCLKEGIPELDNFFTEIKYLQEDVDIKAIFRGRDKKIFEKLKNYPLAFEKCRARLKKKPKSESTDAPKKS